MVDTSNNTELDIEKNTGLTSIIRVCAFHKELITDITDPLYGGYECWWDFPEGDIYLKIRLHKKGVTPVKFAHCTNLWLIIGKFDDADEVKIKTDDVIDFDSKIGQRLEKSVFTPDIVEKTGWTCVADIEQAAIAQGSECPMSIQTSIEVPQGIINKYDGYLGVVK